MKPFKISPLMIIFLTVLIDMIGFGIVIPILPLYSEKLGATPAQIGLLLGTYSAFQLVFAPILGHLSDRIGRKPVLFISILGTAAGFIILGIAKTLPMLFLGRAVDGLSGGNISTAQACIADVTPPEKRSQSMAIIGAAFGLGFMLGPAIGGLLTHYYSIEAPFFFSAALACLNAVLLAVFLPESLPAEKRGHLANQAPLKQIYAQIQGTPLIKIMACYLLATVAFGLVTALYTLFTENRFNWHARENGWMFAYIGFIGVLVQGGLLRRLLKKQNEKALLLIGMLLLSTSMFLLPKAGTFALLVIASSGLAIGNSFSTPILTGLASKSADTQSQGVILGTMQALASLGRLIGPVAGGFLLNYDLHHPAMNYGISPFWTAGIIMVLSVLIALQLKTETLPTLRVSEQQS